MSGIISKSTQDMSWNKTGCWRVIRPIHDLESCIKCDLCTVFCPDACVEQGQIDYDYCKGCGICAEECPKGALLMVEE